MVFFNGANDFTTEFPPFNALEEEYWSVKNAYNQKTHDRTTEERGVVLQEWRVLLYL
jgi:hypothetical protein